MSFLQYQVLLCPIRLVYRPCRSEGMEVWVSSAMLGILLSRTICDFIWDGTSPPRGGPHLNVGIDELDHCRREEEQIAILECGLIALRNV